MIEEVSERCSCGARFKAKSERAEQLLKNWRKQHECPEETFDRDTGLTATADRVDDANYPEMRIGFRGNEWDE